MHRRSQIVAAVVAALEGSGAFPSVDVGRVYFYPEEAPAPGVNVVVGAEVVETDRDKGGEGYQTQTRVLELEVQLYVGAEGDIDAAADTLALEVERALGPLGLGPQSGRVGGYASGFRFVGAEPPDRSGETAGPLIMRTLTYACRYTVDVTDPI